MKNFIHKIVSGNGITPPDFCLHAFNQNFKDTINVDWFDKEDYFEAVFYRNKLEHIARFSTSGSLIEYKQYLPFGLLPEKIKSYLESKGELMNAVLLNKGNCIEYEAIIKDKDSKRLLITLSDLGTLINEKAL